MNGNGSANSDTWRERLRWLTRTALLLAATLALQMLGLPQPFTGPAVNAILILSAILVGLSGGAVIGLFTPLIAFSRGILPPPLGPMIPFIMLGNAALVVIFALIRRRFGAKIQWEILGLTAGAIVKFLILATAVRFIVDVPPPIAKAMQFPQLFTALVGGAVALLISEAVTRALGETKR